MENKALAGRMYKLFVYSHEKGAVRENFCQGVLFDIKGVTNKRTIKLSKDFDRDVTNIKLYA